MTGGARLRYGEPGRKAGTDRRTTVGTSVAERIPEGRTGTCRPVRKFRPAKRSRIAPGGPGAKRKGIPSLPTFRHPADMTTASRRHQLFSRHHRQVVFIDNVCGFITLATLSPTPFTGHDLCDKGKTFGASRRDEYFKIGRRELTPCRLGSRSFWLTSSSASPCSTWLGMGPIFSFEIPNGFGNLNLRRAVEEWRKTR